MVDTLTNLHPLIYLIAAVFVVAVVWALLRGAFKVAAAAVVAAGIGYIGWWMVTGSQPVTLEGFGEWWAGVRDWWDGVRAWIDANRGFLNQ